MMRAIQQMSMVSLPSGYGIVPLDRLRGSACAIKWTSLG